MQGELLGGRQRSRTETSGDLPRSERHKDLWVQHKYLGHCKRSMMELFPQKTPSYMIYRVFVSGAFYRRKKLSDSHAIFPLLSLPLFCFWPTELTLLKQHRQKERGSLECYHSVVYLFTVWMRKNTNNCSGVYALRTGGYKDRIKSRILVSVVQVWLF